MPSLRTFFLVVSLFVLGSYQQCSSPSCPPSNEARRSPAFARDCQVGPGGYTFQRVQKADFTQEPGIITFSEFPVNTQNPTYTPTDYGGLATQPTVTFGGLFVGQSVGSPACGGEASGCVTGVAASPLTLNPNPTTFITNDGANPTSPVLSGSPTFNGPISILLSDTVSSIGFDGGYFDAIGGTAIRAFAADGTFLGQISNLGHGIEFLGITVGVPIIKGVQLSLVGPEPAGFAIDNLIFGPTPEIIPCVPDLCTLVSQGANLLTNSDVAVTTGDIQGSVCSGGSFQAGSGFSIADQLAASPPCNNNFIVQGSVSWDSGRYFSGNALVGGTATLGNPTILIDPDYNPCSYIPNYLGNDCKDAFSNAQIAQQGACAVPSNSNWTLPVSWQFQLVLGTPTSNAYVIDVDSSTLDWRVGPGTFSALSALGPNDIVIFKVSGTSAPSGGTYEDLVPYQNRVFWVWCETNPFNLAFNYNAFRGHVLAPAAVLTGITGDVYGNVVVNSLQTRSSLQINIGGSC
jgi:choice-of-anchor A domain-containing protein